MAWATLEVAKRYGKEAVIGFFPADHWIEDLAGFESTIRAASAVALEQAAIVTLGIQPGYPSTGYGYIEQGEDQGEYYGLKVYRVSQFTEKPALEKAEYFIQTGRFSWNSGMFIFRAGVVLAELNQYAPHILHPLEAQGRDCYPQLEKKSIDYALMEKTRLAYVLSANFGWDDLGDWNALERLLQGEAKNVALARHLELDTQGSILYSSNPEEVIVTIGLEDVVIVRDGNATLVVSKERTQDIKKVLKLMQDNPELEELL